MKTFEEAWKELGYNYGEDALESVRLGWELACKHAYNHFEQLNNDLFNFRLKDGETNRSKLDQSIKNFREKCL